MTQELTVPKSIKIACGIQWVMFFYIWIFFSSQIFFSGLVFFLIGILFFILQAGFTHWVCKALLKGNRLVRRLILILSAIVMICDFIIYVKSGMFVATEPMLPIFGYPIRPIQIIQLGLLYSNQSNTFFNAKRFSRED